MITEKDYLTDQELEALIAQVETEELIPAPPELAEVILERVEEKKAEFRKYCIRVAVASAAAILLVFCKPAGTAASLQEMPGKAEWMEQYRNTEWQEETDGGILERVFGQARLFCGEGSYRLFGE